jgi:hypothetical protein
LRHLLVVSMSTPVARVMIGETTGMADPAPTTVQDAGSAAEVFRRN